MTAALAGTIRVFMARIKNLTARCPHCGAHVLFPATDAGQATTCAQCGGEFDLLPILETPGDSGAPGRSLAWAIIGIVLMLLALGIAVVVLMYLQSRAQPSHSQFGPEARLFEPQHERTAVADWDCHAATCLVSRCRLQSGAPKRELPDAATFHLAGCRR